MKNIGLNYKSVAIFLATIGVFVSGCSLSSDRSSEVEISNKVSEDQIGLRQTPLMDEVVTTSAKTQYSTEQAGSGYVVKRAFQDAPPMIPHDTEGMLPITKNNNACISCHSPEVASAMSATPIPSSHFTDFRPKHKYDGVEFKKAVDNLKNEVAINKKDYLVQARFNCSACHAPQSAGNAPLNTFIPEFTSQDGDLKSTWNEEKYLEGLNTVVEY